MTTWQNFQGDARAWNDLIMDFPDYNVYQAYGWGEHKSHFAWTPLRLVAVDNGHLVAAAQILLKKLPFGFTLAWVPGGPIGNSSAWGDALKKSIMSATKSHSLYCRINPMRRLTDDDMSSLSALDWQIPSYKLTSGKSILIDLSKEDHAWLNSIDKKHRYYVKKSSSVGIVWKFGSTDELCKDLSLLTGIMSQDKGMDLQERDFDALLDLSRSLDDGVKILIGYLEDTPITGCMILKFGNRAHYATAATVGEGRRLSAAYSMFAHLRGLLLDNTISIFDFGGINPNSEKAKGVDHFKGGFGGEVIQYLGEWDWANRPLLRQAANVMIRRRARGM